MVFSKKSVSFSPEKDIPSLIGKVILVTGGNVGLGKQSILEYSRHNPAQIWLAARSIDKAKKAADEIRQQVPNAPIKLLELDLASFESVRQAAKTFSSSVDRLDILMLNAGIMATPAGLTKDGYEIQFGTNHMGHALLAKLLLPLLDRTAKGGADVRIVSLSSNGHRFAPTGGFLPNTTKTTAAELSAIERYGQSKLANILWARQLAKHFPQFVVASIHPGVVQTNLMAGATETPFVLRMVGKISYRFLADPIQGVRNQLWASVSKDVRSGEYYEPVGIGGLASKYGQDDVLAKRLWDWTENELLGYSQ